MIIRKVETVEVNCNINKYGVLRLSKNWVIKMFSTTTSIIILSNTVQGHTAKPHHAVKFAADTDEDPNKRVETRLSQTK
jgi:LPS O-antigen subunit length determinant protein (WzzB/FepE family)